MANYLVHDLDKETFRKRANEYGIPVSEGAFVFVLGTINGGIEDSLVTDTITIEGNTYTIHLGADIGDYASISQEVDLTGMDILRLNLFVRGEKGEGTWKFSILIDGSERDSFEFPMQNFDFKDFAIPVIDLTGNHTIEFRLELI